MDLGLPVFLCCPGPSLAQCSISSGPGRMVVAVNTAYPLVRPDLWIGMDRPGCYSDSLWREPFRKIVRASISHDLRSNPETYLMDLEKFPPEDMFKRRSGDAKFCWDRSTLIASIHLLVWMGARRIHLAGCDFGGSSDYHDGRMLTPEQRQLNRKMYGQQVEVLRMLAPAALSHGVEFVSATDGSPINEFMRYIPLEESASVETTTAFNSIPVRHAMELYQ